MVNQYRSTADAAALLAMSELYRGVAILELVDMTKVTAAASGLTVADQERPKISEAATHFRAATEALSRATEVCASFRSKLGNEERAALMDCDSEGFKRLSDIVARIAVTKGPTLPAFEDVQAAMGAINDATAFWRKSAETLRGSPGHYPGRASRSPERPKMLW
ncbi:MAG TPA: hypothetical protein VHR45_20280 [Thermoanaerobaculia bacterium]|nr:hypothetical protein [Thermoanaerobaculia bacterium]